MAGTRVIFLAVSALAISLLVLLSSHSSPTQAHTYNPTAAFNVTTDTSPGGAGDTTAVFNIPRGDSNFGTLLSFYPPDFWFADDTQVPDGAKVGSLFATVKLSLAGGPCATPLSVTIPEVDSSVDISDELDDAAMNWVGKAVGTFQVPDGDSDGIPDYVEHYPAFINKFLDPDGSGPALPLEPRARSAGVTVVSGQNVLLQFIMLNPGQLGLFSDGIETEFGQEMGYPSIVILQNPKETTAAPSSITNFCTDLISAVTLYGTTEMPPFAINDGCPADGAVELGANCFNDTDDDVPTDGKINDGCPIVGSYAECDLTDDPGTGGPDGDCDDAGDDLTLCLNAADDDGDIPGSFAGVVRSANPSAGSGVLGEDTHIYRAYTQSYRDADSDGYENNFDTCPNTTNIENPYNTNGPDSPNGDALDSACDPTPSGVASEDNYGDYDYDTYHNRQDNCPSVANGPLQDNQWDAETQVDPPASDWGPMGDNIGDACDDSDDDGLEDFGTGGGTTAGNGNCDDGADNDGDTKIDADDPDCTPFMDKDDATPGLVEQGHYHQTMPWDAVCIGALDTDSDGYCDDLEDALGDGSEKATASETPENEILDRYIYPGHSDGAVDQTCTDGVDNDLDGATDGDDTGCQSPDDYDKDGWDELTAPPAGDNCGYSGTTLVWNPEQTDNDGDTIGDACDDNDDIDPVLPAPQSFTDIVEWKTGTDPLFPCPVIVGHHAWPMDQNSDRSVSLVGDVLPYVGNTGKSVSANWDLRSLDINNDGSISLVGDVLKYVGNTGQSCTP